MKEFTAMVNRSNIEAAQELSDQPPEQAAVRIVRAPVIKRRTAPNGGAASTHHQIKLSHGAPLKAARIYIRERHTLPNGAVTLQRHQGDFYAWDGTVYRRMSDDAMRAALYAWLDKTVVVKIDKDGEATEKPFKPTPRAVSDLADALRAQAHIEADFPSWIGAAAEAMPHLGECIVTKNCIVHLPTGECFPPTAELFTATCMPVQYDPAAGAEPEEWLKFLDTLWHDDPGAIDTLQQTAGYLLTPDTIQQKLFLIVGPPRSGKGTIARILTAILGKDSVAFPTLSGIETQFGMQPLIGKSVAIISDARLSGKTDQARVAEQLLSISGEDGVTIDRKNQRAWSGRLRIRFLILTNELPTLSDASGAVPSRFVILDQKKSFLGREDTDLERRLMGELPAILNWAIEGWKKLKTAGRFTMPKSSEEAIRQLESQSSPIKSFVEEECDLLSKEAAKAEKDGAPLKPGEVKGYQVGCQILYAHWAEWCKDRGRHPGSDVKFGKDMKAAFATAGVKRKRSRVDPADSKADQEKSAADRAYYFFGIRRHP